MKKHNDYTRRIKPRIKNKYEKPVTITVANEPSRDKQPSTRYENEEEIIILIEIKIKRKVIKLN